MKTKMKDKIFGFSMLLIPTILVIIIGLYVKNSFHTVKNYKKHIITIAVEDSVYPLLIKYEKKFEIKHKNIAFRNRIVESVSAMKTLFKNGYYPDLFFTEDSWLANKLISKQTLLILPFYKDPIVIAYISSKTKLTNKNWLKIIEKKGFGYSDPNLDPLGYYAITSIELYNKINKTNYSIKPKYLRPETTELVALMKTNNLKYTFMYKSLAIENHLKYFQPKIYDLVDNKYNSLYRSIKIKLNSGFIVTGHEPIFGLCILQDNIYVEKFVSEII